MVLDFKDNEEFKEKKKDKKKIWIWAIILLVAVAGLVILFLYTPPTSVGLQDDCEDKLKECNAQYWKLMELYNECSEGELCDVEYEVWDVACKIGDGGLRIWGENELNQTEKIMVKQNWQNCTFTYEGEVI